SRHLELVDAFGGLAILRDKLRQRYEEWQGVTTELAELETAGREKADRVDRFQTQIAEIDAGRLRAGEEDQLREERKRLQTAERLAEGAGGAYQHLYDDPAAAATRLGQAIGALRELAKIDAALGPTVQALDGVAVQLDEAVRAVRGYRDGIVFDPPRLDEIERRLDELGRLKRKYGETVEAILAARNAMVADMERLGPGDGRGRDPRGRLGERPAQLVARGGGLPG